MKALIDHITTQLLDLYPEDEARSLAWWIMEETTGLSRSEILSGCKDTKNIPNLQTIIDRLHHFEPIQYIFGHTLWAGLDLKVTPATLIPRPETAELVDRIDRFAERAKTASLKEQRPLHVMDVGTGSGCISIALKKRHPEWQVTGIDISAEAIEVAKENAARNDVQIDFQVADIFDSNGQIRQSPITNHQYDIIVSNPPYICESEKATMRPNVLDYEPASALFVPDDDPLRVYRRIAELFANLQSPITNHQSKFLFFEIHEVFSSELSALLTNLGYTDIQITNDIYGKPRIIEGRMA